MHQYDKWDTSATLTGHIEGQLRDAVARLSNMNGKVQEVLRQFQTATAQEKSAFSSASTVVARYKTACDGRNRLVPFAFM
jgi:hypothetical protein